MTVRQGPIRGGPARRNRRPDQGAVVAAGARHAIAAESVTRRRPTGVLLMVAALVLGIGSCQLPQPHLPKLLVGAVAGSTYTADHGGTARAARPG